MALITDWANRGTEFTASVQKSTRIYRVGNAGDFTDYKEEVNSEQNFWVGFTEAGASSAIDQALVIDPTFPTRIYSWEMSEESRVVHSYRVTRTWEEKLTTIEATSPVPEFGVPTITPPSNFQFFPVPWTITTSQPDVGITYRTGQALGAGGFIEWNDWIDVNDTTVTFSYEPDRSSEGKVVNGSPTHKIGYVEAREFVQYNNVPGEPRYEGDVVSDVFNEFIPDLSNSIIYRTPIGSNNANNPPINVSMPFNLTLGASNTFTGFGTDGSYVIAVQSSKIGSTYTLGNDGIVSDEIPSGNPVSINTTNIDNFGTKTVRIDSFLYIKLDDIYYDRNGVFFNPDTWDATAWAIKAINGSGGELDFYRSN